MNRAERRRQQKQANKQPAARPAASGDAAIQQALNLALHHQASGRLADALTLGRQVVGAAPNNPVAHNVLGNILKATNDLSGAEDCYRKALALKPDFVEAHFNLGNALVAQKKRTEAADSYAQAVALRADLVPAHMNLGNVLLELGRADEAEACYRKALTLKPDHINAHINLAEALKSQGAPEAAMQVLLDCAGAHPGSEPVIYSVIELLNYCTPDSDNPLVQAQRDLNSVAPLDDTDDVTLHDTFEACETVLTDHGLTGRSIESQIWRGKVGEENCQRHMEMFNAFNAIPEFCFGCYKVTVSPRTVAELFKLFVVFDRLELPRDNSRKCFVELRADISGTYKGLIYCAGREDALETERTVRRNVSERISPDVPISVKRGCSEYEAAYPEYARADDTAGPPMAYDESWREHETYTDRYLAKHKYPNAFATHNHDGFTIRDVLVMRTWLSYAKAIGDDSYRHLTETPVEAMDVGNRPPFKPIQA